MDTASLPPLLAQSTGLNGLAFRSDGRLAVADMALNVEIREGNRVVWSRSLASNEPKLSSIQRLRGLAFSPDGATLAVLGPEGPLVLDAETGWTIWSYEPPRTFGFLVVSGTALAVRDDGLIAAAFDNGAIGTWTPDGGLLGLWKDVDAQRHLAFLPDGRLLGDDSFGLNVFDVEARKRLSRTPLRDRSFGLAVSPQGHVAVRTLHEAWQMTPLGEVFARTPVDPGLPTLAYHPSEPLLALGAARSVVVVDAAGDSVGRFEVSANVTALAFAPDGALVVGGANGGLESLPVGGRAMRA